MLLYGSISMWVAMGLIFWYNRQKRNASIYLGFLLFVMGFHGVSHAILLNTSYSNLVPYFYNIWSPLYVLPGPVLFLYLRASKTGDIRLKKADWLHFLPFLILVIDILPYWFSSFGYKKTIAAEVLRNPNQILQLNLNWFLPAKMNMLLRPVLMICYSLLGFRLLYARAGNDSESNIRKAFFLNWQGVICTIIFLVGISYLITLIKLNNLANPEADKSYFVFRSPFHEIGAMIFIAVPVLLNFFPQILYGTDWKEKEEADQEGEKMKSIAEEPLSEEEEQKLRELSERINRYLGSEKPYLNPRFSIDELSRALEVPRHQLYKCLAKQMKIKFTDLRMQLRIEHAKQLLNSGMADLNKLEAVAIESGFVSRSNFHIAFKALTGLTPTEYLEQLKSRN